MAKPKSRRAAGPKRERNVRVPLCLYVLWHPACREAAGLADAVYEWFSASTDDLHRAGLGLPVYFRGALFDADALDGAGAEARPRAPRPISLDDAVINLIVPLIDPCFATDPVWVRYLSDLQREVDVRSKERARSKEASDQLSSAAVYPVALHPAAYSVSAGLHGVNFLRFDDHRLASAEQILDPAERATRNGAIKRQQLVRQLTEVCARHLLGALSGVPEGEPPRPVTVFLSHAKRDGREIAAMLRNAIVSYGQIRPFFDENDLAIGHRFAATLDEAARHGTAAMITVVTDAYASRPWCRREIRLARSPRRTSPRGALARVWRIQPVFVVSHLRGERTRVIPELGNVPSIRWRADQAEALLDMLMLEVLLSAYHELTARELAEAYAREGAGRLYINWVPDPGSLATLLHEASEAKQQPTEIAYPGHGLSWSERQEIEERLDGRALRTFADVGMDFSRFHAAGGAAGRPVVAVSVGNTDDIEGRGFGRDHLDAVALRLARALLRAGYDLAYGGTFRGETFIETFLSLVAGEQHQGGEDEGLAEPRLINYQPWPHHRKLDPVRVAEQLGISRFVRVDPAEGPPQREPGQGTPRAAYLSALALTAMRESMLAGGRLAVDGGPVPGAVARVVLGGRRRGWNGFVPGIAEEAAHALEANLDRSRPDVPLYIIGGWGGASRLLARVLGGHPIPEQLRYDYHAGRAAAGLDERYRKVLRGAEEAGQRSYPKERFEALEALLRRAAEDPQRALANGLSAEENLRLYRSENLREISILILRGLAQKRAEKK